MAPFNLYVHKSGLKPVSLNLIYYLVTISPSLYIVDWLVTSKQTQRADNHCVLSRPVLSCFSPHTSDNLFLKR